jgi:hypothetical protein
MTKDKQLVFLGGLLSFATLAFLVAGAVWVITGSEKKPVEKQKPAEKSIVVVEERPTVQQRLDAAGRSEEGASKICYDESRDSYFVLYENSEMKYSGKDPEKGWNGWFYTEKIKLYKLPANNTWFATETPADSYSTAYPDVAGLPCKELAKK